MTTLISVPAKFFAWAHTSIAATAFIIALLAGWLGGTWKALCTNSVARWPVEWFPSVSAVAGDHPQSRAPFHILIALCAGPRFLVLLLQWLSHRHGSISKPPITRVNGHTSDESRSTAYDSSGIRTRAVAKAEAMADQATEDLTEALSASTSGPAGLADIELIVGLARTFCCGGWMYVTSRDSHGLHDMFMIVYLLLNLPWMYLSIVNAPSQLSRRRRKMAMGGFLLTIPPLIWMYYRHNALRIPGAYTHYAFFEWSLVIWDIAFDSFAVLDMQHLQITVVDATKASDENGPRPNGFFLETSRLAGPPLKDLHHDWTSEGREHGSAPFRAFLAWMSDVYLAICFWTVFTSLSVQLFYWSVWKLALAGSEAALLANLSAYTLSSPRAFRYATSREGLLAHRIVMVMGGMASWILPIPFARLVAVFVGTWTGWSALFGNWARLRGSKEMLAEGQVFGLGLAITMFIKYMNYSTNPFWCIVDSSSGGWNKTGLGLGVLALIEYAYRPLDLFPAPPLRADGDEKKNDRQPSRKPSKMQRTAIILGLGSFVHLVQTFLSDSGTIIAWTWTGYPITGPTLHPFAGLVIAMACVGTTSTMGKLAELPAWGVVGSFGALALYVFPDFTGYFGGLAVTLYLSALIPSFFRYASVGPFSSTWGHALLVNCLIDVISVVTTAYAFVPLGWLVRERTDLVLIFTISCIEWGRWAGRQLSLPSDERLALRSRLRISRTSRWTLLSSLTISALAVSASYRKMPTSQPELYYPDHRQFTAGIWTVHFGIDEPGRDSQWRMLDLVRDMKVDVLGLLETDLHRFVYGNRDLTRAISEELGYYVDLGPGPNKHTWGAALLSKFPILNSTHHLLPSPHGELAPAIHATLDIHGEHINVFVSHNGQFEDALDRELQTTEIARLLRETEEQPTVFLGYLVTKPHAKRPSPYQILMEDGKMNDIEKADKWRWCEYIAFRGVWRVAYARVHESDISDTELQVGKFLLPRPGYPIDYKSDKETYWHIGEKDIPEPWRMPPEFWNEGVRGHRYVKWVGPLYYLPPEHSGVQRYGWDWSTEYTS